MRLDDVRESDNVEDRRGGGFGGPPGGGRGFGGGFNPKVAGGGIGAIVIALLVVFMGGDPGALLNQLGGTGVAEAPNATRSAVSDEQRAFVAKVLATTEDVWGKLLPEMGRRYVEPKLVLFTGEVHSACGHQSAAVGPFYCPGDSKVYLDLAFFDELARRFQAPGDFAAAYVIGHEIGHHVQNLLGASARVSAARGRVSEVEENRQSVRLELQADFYAGVWAHHAQKRFAFLEPGDLEEALRAAFAIGDDALQKKAQGYVVPDSFTHGTSAQRIAWFKHGFRTGDPAQGDTFDDRVFNAVSPR
jgi:predicted metalloprotease